MPQHVTAVSLALLLSSCGALAAEPGGDLQRLQIQRDQQQFELGLKMQQQQERAMRPLPSGELSTELQRRQFERDQLQRQQQFFDEQTRATIAPSAQPPVSR